MKEATPEHQNHGTRLRWRPSQRPAGQIRVLILCAGLLLTAGCVRGCISRQPPIHLNPNMDRQPKYLAQSRSHFFYDGASMRVPVEGTVARGELWEDESIYIGVDLEGEFVANPFPAEPEFLERGRKYYRIYCTPCHAKSGNGESMLKAKAGVQTANLLEDRIREMPDGQIFYVISVGFGLMSGYQYPIQVRDRWAIVAYVRQLQEGNE